MSAYEDRLDAGRVRLGADVLRDPASRTRAGLMVAAARSLVGAPYVHEGRVATGMDGFGLIQLCAQAVMDHAQGFFHIADRLGTHFGRNKPDPIRPQIQHDEVDYNDLAQMLEGWGMARVPFPDHGARYTQAGDVKVMVGVGPAGSIVTTGFQPGQTEWVITAWRPNGPEVRSDCMLSRHMAALYRWPEAAEAPRHG